MICFEVAPTWDEYTRQFVFQGHNIKRGIPLDLTHDNVVDVLVTGQECNVDASHKRARLSEALRRQYVDAQGGGAFTHSVSRLQRCDLDKRGSIYLLPEESDENDDDVLLLFWQLSQRPFGKFQAVQCYIKDGTKAEILLQSGIQRADYQFGKAFLVHLKPGGQIEADWRHWTKRTSAVRNPIECVRQFFGTAQEGACVITNVGGSLAVVTGGRRVTTAGMAPAEPTTSFLVPPLIDASSFLFQPVTGEARRAHWVTELTEN